MTKQDDELKKLFRQKHLEEGFAADEQNWEKMASVLKDEEKDRRRGVIYFSLLLLLLGLTGGGWLFVKQAGGPAGAMAQKQQRGEAHRNSVKRMQQHKPGSATTAIKPVQAAQINNYENVQIPQRTKPVALPGKPQQLPTARVVYTLAQTKAEAPKYTGAETAVKNVKEKQDLQPGNETAATLPAPLLTGTVAGAEEIPGRALPDRPVDKATVAQAKESFETIGKPDEVLMPAAMMITTTTTSVTTTTPAITTTAIAAANTTTAITVTTTPTAAAMLAADTAVAGILPSKTGAALLTKTDSAAGILLKDSMPFKAIARHAVFLEAGASYQAGWRTNDRTEGRGFNPLAGLQYYYRVSSRLWLSAGLQYNAVGHLGASSHTSTTTRLKFGEEVDMTVITALNMHYLSIPFKLSYGFGSNNLISVGYTIGYLLDVESRVEQYTRRMDYSGAAVVSRSMGYKTGFNAYDGQLAACYRRRLYKGWYVNGELFYGIADIKKNNVYASHSFERTCGLKLSVGINLLKK